MKSLSSGARRKAVQLLSALIANANFKGFIGGALYKGGLKGICVPGLNCYSCPGALGACPLGALQNSLADPSVRPGFYVLGLISVFGLLFGRFICGFLCPFGLFQELLYVPLGSFLKKHSSIKVILDRYRPPEFLKYIKYIVLAAFVVLLPVFATDGFGFGLPWFCTYICPAGMVMGAFPLMAADSKLIMLAGFIFRIKLAICVSVLVMSLFSKRFFCKYLCPLGAVYGFFNKLSFYRINTDSSKCTACGLCAAGCPMNVDPSKNPNSAECVRCGECTALCPSGALSVGFEKKR